MCRCSKKWNPLSFRATVPTTVPFFAHKNVTMVSMLELSERDFAACKLSIEKTLRNRAPLHRPVEVLHSVAQFDV